MRKKIFFFLLIIAFIIAFSATASAEKAPIVSNINTATRYDDFSSFNMSVLAGTDTFNWKENSYDLKDLKTETGLPGYVLFGSSLGNTVLFDASLKSTIDAYSYKSLSFAVRIATEESSFAEKTVIENCGFILTIRSGDETFTSRATIKSSGWYVVTFDVSAWKYRKSITDIDVHIECEKQDSVITSAEVSGPYVAKTKSVDMKKFMSYGLFAYGNEIEILNKGKKNETLRINLSAQRLTVSGDAYVPYSEERFNAVKILLKNNSELKNMQFQYSYFDVSDGKLLQKIENIALQDGDEYFAYIAMTGDVNHISSFSLILENGATGSVSISSIEPISIYEGFSGPYYGSLSSCKRDTAKKTIDISGTVNYNFLIHHNDYSLHCYQIHTSENFENVLKSGAKPIATAKMSSSFSFEIKLSSLDEYALVSKYAVAAVSPEGEHFLLAPPISVKGDFGVPETASGRSNIKGILYEDAASILDYGMGSSIVDVYLDKLTNDSQTGHLYTIDGTHIYFNANYVSELDSKIKNLSASGCKVYLRLLISKDADPYTVPYAFYKTLPKSTEYIGVNIKDREAEKHFFATVDYICGRYSKYENGKISGLILGRALDMVSKYNYVENGDISVYSEKVAKALDLMARTAVISIPGIEIVFPVSDMKSAEGKLDTELLLASVCRYFDQSGPFEFSLMLESTHAPYSLTQKNGATAPSDDSSNYYCSDNIGSFERLLGYLLGSSSSAPRSYIYAWIPNESIGDLLPAAYIYNYYSMMFSEKASSFAIIFPEGTEVSDEIKYLMKYIDTERNIDSSLSLPALDVFAAESFEELIGGYDKDLITYRVLYETASLEQLPENIKGSYNLWNFSGALGNLGWFAGSNCRSLALDPVSLGEKTLCASVSRANADGSYSDITYSYEFAENISLIPYLEFDFHIEDDDPGALYEILVIIGSSGNRIEVKNTAISGADSRLLVSISEYKNIGNIDHIRICFRPSESDAGEKTSDFKFHLRKVTAHSDKYNSDELEEAIKSARESARSGSTSQDNAENQEPSYDLIVLAIIFIIICVSAVAFYERKRK